MPGMLLHHEKRLDVFMSGTFFAIGFSPITALAVAIFGLLPLPVNTLLIVLPATVLGIGLAVRFPTYCLLYTSPSPRDLSTSRMPSSA